LSVVLKRIGDKIMLIFGANGFVGKYLVDFCKDKNKIIATYHSNKMVLSHANVTTEKMDVNLYDQVANIILRYKPEKIFNLITAPCEKGVWLDPQKFIRTNIEGTINILESIVAIRKICHIYSPTILLTSTSMCYGENLIDHSGVLDESTPLKPLSPYSFSKSAQEEISFIYYKKYEIKTIVARLFSVAGPGSMHGPCYNFTKKAVMIEKKLIPPTFDVGDLSAKRVTDVRDVVKGLVLLADKGTPANAYNVCGSQQFAISDVLQLVKKLAKVKFKTVEKKDLYKIPEKEIIGNPSKFINATGFKEKFTLEQTLNDMMEYFRLKSDLYD
jgi:GDP-4-dehydro-6-deoxy-D-mannose reductase